MRTEMRMIMWRTGDDDITDADAAGDGDEMTIMTMMTTMMMVMMLRAVKGDAVIMTKLLVLLLVVISRLSMALIRDAR